MQKIKCYNGRASIVGLTLFAFTILAILGAFNSPTNAADRERSWHIDARSLTIRNMIGSVKVEPASGNEFVVTAVIGGKNSDGHLLEFKLDEGKSTLLNVVYPLDKYRKYKYPEHKGKTSFSGWNFDDDVSVLSKVFRASNKKITVSNNSGEVEVWCDFHIQIPEGKVLKVENGVGKMDAVDAVGDITLDTASGNLSFTNCRGELTADTGSGDVSVKQVGGEILIDTGSGDVEGTDIKGPIDIDTGSGDVFLKEMQCAQILVDTGSGSVQLFNFISDKVDVDTGSGDVTLDGVSAGYINIDTGSGDVEVILDETPRGKLLVDTGSGGIHLELPRDASAELQADTGNGKIHFKLPEAVDVTTSKDELELTLGDGDLDIELDTGSGNIRIFSES
ncbi:MAG: DUF4097 domain-containing protein [Candidatus Eisenbacteria bacterium]|uniref:DUF4097 domain-containing protein n=1 Tax=Eiseniibacteriota bacterium TaxID=2212470 RepID=A0A948W6P2_UNCEI|nr:DUF4097 domain-containing protein [Candidatus Eisenbacteria bacterium]MBU2691719.1 DUF4097 domain-containing protein [Candidatus Eisenbacteria bacterium]